MKQIRFAAQLVLLGLMLIRATDATSAELYPNKPIRIVTNTAGGGTDLVARLVSLGISGPIGQQVVVDNRPPFVLVEIVQKAQPDGYTLLVESGTLWIAPFLGKVSYDPIKDFLPVSLLMRAPNVLVVHPSMAVNSVKELIALAKTKPGELNYSSGTTGSTTQLAAELFNAMAGVKFIRIPYNGTAPALNALVGGQTQLMFMNTAGALPLVKAGKLKALGVTSGEPSALAPGLPTVASSGLPGFVAVVTYVIWAPANTPAPLVGRLNKEIVRYLNSADAKEKVLNAGLETVASSPEAAAAEIKADMTRWGKVIKEAGIKSE